MSLLFYHLEVFGVDVADGDGIASEVHDELTIAVDADDIAFLTCEGTTDDAEADAVLSELDEGVAEEGDALGSLAHHGHEGLHDTVGDGGWLMGGAVINKVILGEVVA